MAQHGFDLAGRPAVILIAEENQIAAAGLEGAQKALAKAVILRGGQNFPVNLGMRIIGLLGECRKNFPYYSMDGRGMHEKTGMARSRLPVAHRKRK